MRFVSEVLSGESGVQILNIIGILIFVSLFIVILYRTYKMPKKDIIDFKTSILDQEDGTENNSNTVKNL